MRVWTVEEKDAIDAALVEVNRKSQHVVAHTIESLVEQWKAFVQEVERGYAMSIYDYTNDLSVRDILDNIIGQTPAGVQQWLRMALEPWDDRYRLATRPSDRPILPGPDVAQKPRWKRVPRQLSGELLDDLMAEGVIGSSPTEE